MHCLFGIKDELHDYAAAIHAYLLEYVRFAPLESKNFGGFDAGIIGRSGRLQAELITIRPCVAVPMHCHPGVESIDMLVAGNVMGFQIGEKRIARFVKGIGLRIAADAMHGGVAGAKGVVFLSCQRWNREPDFIARSWVGDPVSDEHERLLEHLKAVA